MKARIGRYVAALAVVLAIAGCVAPSARSQAGGAVPVQPAAEFEQFWAGFRTAALTGDVNAVAAMTRFPLEVRGELDDDPVRRAARPELAALLARVLDADTGLSAREQLTNRMLLERAGTPIRRMPGVSVTPASARIGAFAFERDGTRWQLRRIYLPDD